MSSAVVPAQRCNMLRYGRQVLTWCLHCVAFACSAAFTAEITCQHDYVTAAYDAAIAAATRSRAFAERQAVQASDGPGTRCECGSCPIECGHAESQRGSSVCVYARVCVMMCVCGGGASVSQFQPRRRRRRQR